VSHCSICPAAPQGKLFTEELLDKSGVNWTSIRPVYIYGPLNYNPVEEWFFHRLAAGRPVPVPGSGMQVRTCWLLGCRAEATVQLLCM
jgi:nucleoside-diphosphate-sugar epimerase